MGYLTGKIKPDFKFDAKKDLRSGFERFSAKNLAANQPIIDLIEQFGARKNAGGVPATPAQISLAWLLAQKPFIVPIPGTRSIQHLTENLGAVNIELTNADLAELETQLAKITVNGRRMNEMQMKIVE
jgi:aryl-alcohol dehydrogenase-like predicted oxidoreductase